MPGGALAVGEGDAVVPLANALIRRFAHVVVTQDWHPPGHASFASTHAARRRSRPSALAYGEQTLWPDHCVQGTPGAALHPELATDAAFLILRKGMHEGVDSYSAFVEADGARRPASPRCCTPAGSERVFACGLATDFCVAYSAPSTPARRGFRGLRHRGRLPGDRRRRLASEGVGADGSGRGLAHPVAGDFGLAARSSLSPPLAQPEDALLPSAGACGSGKDLGIPGC